MRARRSSSSPHQADLELARAAARGDESAFRELFDYAFPRLYRFAIAHIGDPEGAEELVQQTLCLATAHLHDYRGEAALLTWLTTICRRELEVRRRRQARGPVVVTEADRWLESLPSRLDGPGEAAARRELATRVHRVLDWLPAGYAQILGWKYFEEASVEEISRRLGIAPKAAESRLTRAREAFRREFAVLAAAPALPEEA